MELLKINDILNKIHKKNSEINAVITKSNILSSEFWYYNFETGKITNKSDSFFQIAGIKSVNKGRCIEQPIIIQNEIGYLGIIQKKIKGEMHYLMQYKVEPGNVNIVQISPTVQATKSNFMLKHGGGKPLYLEYFFDNIKYNVIVDQIQSEQSSRFFIKRNRNIIIELPENEEIEVYSNYDWMTLTQIKQLMKYDNLVNMDSRTVLSCIPYSLTNYSATELEYFEKEFKDKALFNSIFHGFNMNFIPKIYSYINNYKMFDETKVELMPLNLLKNWSNKNNEFVCNEPYNFKVIFCDIEIEGREVGHWDQPLIAAEGIATFGLFTCIENDVRLFLVRCFSEIGCFDKIEIGPTIQREFVNYNKMNDVDRLFDKKLNNNDNVIFNTLLSEEGGRFYHEQNRNVIIEIDKNDVEPPEGYFWCDFKTLNILVQVNNVLNIQLRNLLSVLEF